MRVQFDLRPVSLLEKERKKRGFNIVRLLAMILLLVFLASTIFYIATVSMKVMGLQGDIEVKEGEVSALESSQRALEAEINRLKAEEKVYADTLKIMQDDLPTLEVLNALDANMEEGMAANILRFTPPRAAGGPNTAVLEATAAAEDQIVALTNGLSSSGVFSGVTMPTSKKDEKTGRIAFTLNLDLRPIGQIKSTSAK